MARFGAYEILHELKSGGMGAVLLGRRKGPGAFEQLVAIKTIRPEYATTEAVRAMFLDEAKIVGGINHPAIATIHDFGEQAGTLYMVMEYVAGLSFRSVMELGMPPGVAARAIAEACRGLHAAHEVRDIAGQLQGVVHRDVSPDNLLLGYDGHVKVIDFGIALVKNRQSPVTEFGTVKGKPPYMSPEQVKNEALDRRSDVFSLAVVMHELLTGQMLFDGDSIYAIARQVEHMEIPPPSKVIGAPLPLGLDAVVMNALVRDPERRTPSAAAFAEQLEQVIGSSGDETLEAWAERTLAGARDQHRAWLADVVGKVATVTPPIGRATGSVTALGPLAFVDQLPAAPAMPPPHDPPPHDPPLHDPPLHDPPPHDPPPHDPPPHDPPPHDPPPHDPPPHDPPPHDPPPHDPHDPPPPRPEASTHLSAASDDEPVVAPRRSLALPILLALVLALSIGAVMVFSSRSSKAAPDAAIAVIDASPDTAVVVVARDTAPDAAPDAEEPDAGVDAGRVVVRDARRNTPPPDAAVVVAPPPEVAPVGTGKLTARGYSPTNTYLDVVVDGKTIGRTPLLGAELAAGPHTVTLVNPVGAHEVMHTEKIVIVDGKTTTVTAK